MKKLLIILLLLLSGNASSQTGYYKRIKVIDSIYIPSGIINASGYYLNGVLQTFGGSPFDLTAFHEFTGINKLSNGTYFNDSAKFTQIVIMDSLKVNNRISGYGPLIDSLSASFIRTGTIDTARLPNDVAFANQPNIFSGLVKFITNVVDFAAGITSTSGVFSTTLAVSGITTFSSDVIFNGYRKVGAASNVDKYIRDTVLRVVCSAAPVTLTIAHGLANVSKIQQLSCVIIEGGTGYAIVPGATNLLGSTYTLSSYPYADATNIYLRLTAGMTDLDDATDTLKVSIRVADLNR